MLNPYDFIYDEPSKCVSRAMAETKVMQIDSKVIKDMLVKYPEFKKKWYKSIFVYCLRLGRGL